MADRSDAAKKAAETRRQRKLAEEYAAHNVRRPDPETGQMEVVSTPDHPEVLRHPIDPLPDPHSFSVQREGSTSFVDGVGGQVVLRYSGPGVTGHADLRVTVMDRGVYDALTAPAAPWWDVTLSPRRARP